MCFLIIKLGTKPATCISIIPSKGFNSTGAKIFPIGPKGAIPLRFFHTSILISRP